MKDNNNLAELLRERKLKATTTRLEVLSVICEYHKAIPFSKIQNALCDFDRVTLYRTINSLLENGIIHKALKEENETFYAMCSTSCTSETHDHQHIHFKCTNCGAVTCVQSHDPVSLAIPGHLIENYEIAVTGLCESCNS